MKFAVCLWTKLCLCAILIAWLPTAKANRQRLYHWKTDSNSTDLPDSSQRIRLLGDKNSYTSGQISIYSRQTWGYVCGANWDMKDATVACKQLGFQRAISASATSVPRKTGLTPYSITSGEVRCTGKESSLQQCPTSRVCSRPWIAVVECEENPDCPDGWASGSDTCYKFFASFKVRSIKQAANECAIENASLVTVLTRKENHFLSDLLTNLAPDIHHWHTGGSLVKDGWVWSTPVNKRGEAPISRDNILTVPFTEDLWFPGWPSYKYQYAEPTNQIKKECLTLSNQYRHPSGDMRNVNYFFWKASWCRKWQGINFICQRDKTITAKRLDCYVGDGSTYRGKTSATNTGNLCLSWADSLLINQTTHPQKGLGNHNFCRNPDNDHRPWCWIDHGKYLRRFDYCKIPICTETTFTAKTTNIIDSIFTLKNGTTEALTTELNKTPSTLATTTPYSQVSTKSMWAETTTRDSQTFTTQRTSSIEWKSPPQTSNIEQTLDLDVLNTAWTMSADTLASQQTSSFEIQSPTTVETTTSSLINYTVSLVNGEGPWEGRVQITIGERSGTVCDDHWDDRAATVVCRSLGWNSGGIAFTGAEFGRGSGPIWLDNVQCTGREHNLDQCRHNGWNKHDCDHWEDASVHCFKTVQANRTDFTTTTITTPYSSSTTTTSFSTTTFASSHTKSRISTTTKTKAPPSQIQSSMVKLVGGSAPHQGNVEIQISNTSYRICDDNWNDQAASVVCRMLGYRSGGQATKRSRFGKGNFAIILDNVECTGKEQSLDDCLGIVGTKKHDCDISEFAGVVCITEKSNGQVCGQRPFDNLNVARSQMLRNTKSLRNRFKRTVKLSTLPSNLSGFGLQHIRKARMAPIQPKITGGITVPYGMYPWQVNFRRITSRSLSGRYSFQLVCGGTIISEYWLLTAAHCFTNEVKKDIQVGLGDHQLFRADKFEQVFEIEDIIPHERFNAHTLDYDIALVKIKRREGRGIIFNNFVQPACLPTASTPYRSGTMCDISGWGRTESNNAASKARILQAASVPLVHWYWCKIAFISRHFSDRMMCAGYVRGGKDTCRGDSGGPLVCKDKGTYTLFGITSWGLGGCGESLSPGVYSHVVKFLPWIQQTIQSYSATADERFIPAPP